MLPFVRLNVGAFLSNHTASYSRRHKIILALAGLVKGPSYKAPNPRTVRRILCVAPFAPTIRPLHSAVLLSATSGRLSECQARTALREWDSPTLQQCHSKCVVGVQRNVRVQVYSKKEWKREKTEWTDGYKFSIMCYILCTLRTTQ